MKTISVSEANRHFSQLLRDVEQGETVLITSRSRPVATLSPAPVDRDRQAAHKALIARLRARPTTGQRLEWTRDELYD